MMRTLLIPIALAALTVTSCKPPQPPAAAPGKTSGPVAHAPITAPGDWMRVDGQGVVETAKLGSEPTLIFIFAPWADSASAVPGIIRDLEEGGFRVLPAAVRRLVAGESSPAHLASAAFPVVWAEDANLAALDIRALPSIVVLDNAGRPARTWAGHVPVTTIIAPPPEPAS